jgi:ADP-ribose pyrophosphatase
MFANPPGAGFFILLEADEIRHAETQAVQRLADKGLPSVWAQVGVVYEDQYLLILRDAVRFADGQYGTYIRRVARADSVPGVVILPVYNGLVLLTHHFRHATRAWHLEIPRGFGTKGLSNEANARRELEEETGGSASRLISLGQMHVNTGMSSECVELFYAETISIGQPDIHEAISEVLPINLTEFERLMRKGEITDGFTIVAYTRAKLCGLL